MQLVISDPKSAKAYSKKIEDLNAFLNKKIGESVEVEAPAGKIVYEIIDNAVDEHLAGFCSKVKVVKFKILVSAS